MARLSNDQLKRIKQDISLLDLVESQGYRVKKIGKDHAISCPFHDDNTPSLIISPKTNLYHCFGCGAAGSVIDWVMYSEQLSFRPAVEKLREQLPLLAAEKEKPEPVEKATSFEDDQVLLKRVIDFYHDTLKQSSEALAYLKSRGLDDAELIDFFKLGYANRTLGLTLPDKTRKAGAEIRSQLQDIGIYRESGHEHFNGSLVIPVMNEQGEITEVYGRKLLDKLRKGTPKHLYLPGLHEGVFNPSCFSSADIILCESLIDALTFWRHGFKNVTTSYGTEGFTLALLEAFKQHHSKRIFIAYDNDKAGNTAAAKLAKQLLIEGIDCYRIEFPKGMDANEYCLKVNPPRKSVELVIQQAKYLGDGEDPRQAIIPESMAECVAEPGQQTTRDNKLKVMDGEVHIPFGERSYRVRGLDKASNYQQLKINLCLSVDDNLHIDQLDLYHAKQRQAFIKQAAIELNLAEEVIKKDLSKVLLRLEEQQRRHIQKSVKSEEKAVEMDEDEKNAALELLQDPSLLSRLLEDLDTCGVVGEESNKLVGYLAAVSRKLDKPLAVIVQSTSAAGKSALMDAVLAMIPEAEKVQYSAMTGQSLFYMGETNLKHKILAIAEEEGADQASYALKLLQSEGELTIASTGKDTEGNLTTQEYRVEGPVMLFSTTTAIDIDEELMNRCIVLTVNESEEQTQRIHALQRETSTLEGLIAGEERDRLLQVHRHAQQLLQPMNVVNPYAKQLTFMSHQTRFRRDHTKYLRLINSITLLHQYQREHKTMTYNNKKLDYIEVSLDDIAVANDLAHEVLGRSLDELPPQTRKLLGMIQAMVDISCVEQQQKQSQYRFTRRDIREVTGWSDGQLKIHCHRLEEMEYLLVHGGGRGRLLEYELLYDGKLERTGSHMMGLVDMKIFGYDPQKSGLHWEKLGLSQGQVRGKTGSSQGHKIKENTVNKASNIEKQKINGKHSTLVKKYEASYRRVTIPLAAKAHDVESV